MASESTTNLVGQWGRKDSGVADLASHQENTLSPAPPKFEICEEESASEQESEDSRKLDDSDSASGGNESKWGKFYHFLCPPRGASAKWLTWCIVCMLILGVMWSLAPERIRPGENMFGLVVTILLCFIAEVLIVKIPTCKDFPPLPRLLASLLMGLALANLPSPANIATYIDPHFSWTLRTMSLAVILTRAGLELDPSAMERVKWAVIRLAFLPCVGETITIGVVAHYILGFPFVWSFMMGFLIAAVSPAVVIPSLILLQEKGLGRDKGVPSLVMAASGIDDVLAIAGFTVLLGIAMPAKLEADVVEGIYGMMSFTENKDLLAATSSPTDVTDAVVSDVNSTESIHATTEGYIHNNPGREIAGALIEVVIGVFAGLVCGFFISYIPHKTMPYKSFCRGTLLLGIGIFAVFASDYWGIPGSGALWALITSFVAALHWKEECKPLEVAWHHMWIVFQPILFGLTGATVDVNMMDATTVGLGLAVLAIGLLVRMMVSSSVTWGLNLRLKEKAFVSIAWIPKGTVQAALGSAALDTAITLGRPDYEVKWGEQIFLAIVGCIFSLLTKNTRKHHPPWKVILVLAVLVTLLTAPIGAFGISISGPKLLTASIPEGVSNAAFSTEGEVGSLESGMATEGSTEEKEGVDTAERYMVKADCSEISDNALEEQVTSI